MSPDLAYTDKQQASINSCVRSGLRQFYFPPPIDGQGAPYDWSFLKPVGNVTLLSGKSIIGLPDDFGGFEGQLTIASTSGQQFWPLDLVGVGKIYAKQSELPTTTGRPLMACEEPIKGTLATQGQRFQLRFWPIADQNYTLQFAYYLLPDALSGAFPFAYGGMAHGETILESCLSVAEQRIDDESTVHSMKFKERLAASINLDRRNKPQSLGYNGDRSDGLPWGRTDNHGLSLVKVSGVQY